MIATAVFKLSYLPEYIFLTLLKTPQTCIHKKITHYPYCFYFEGTAFAQEKNGKKDGSQDEPYNGHEKDFVMMKEGKMMRMMNGKLMAMDNNMTMSDRTVCLMDGSCNMKGGTMMVMKEGGTCYMDGKMGKMKLQKGMKHKM